jgi:hypothetical protein
MILDQNLLGRESRALLRAILKLRPSAAIVVLCDSPETAPPDLAADVIFDSITAPPDRVIASMINARSLAPRRIAQEAGMQA